ncbi:MAG: SAP domain-containing protein [Parachlamydiales bacterium]|jgi:hypothetical protein
MKNEKEHLYEYDFGAAPPILSLELSPEVFKKHYYDKKTLMQFCRKHKISTTGLKKELSDRIEHFLRTGQIPVGDHPKKLSSLRDSLLGLTLERRVVNYKSDLVTREFFIKHIPAFTGFSAYVQKWLKERLANCEVFTYGDVIEEHKRFQKEQLESKLLGKPRKVVHASCEYNQFLIDYSQDNELKPHSSIKAWKLVRNSAGAKTYTRYKAMWRKN